MSISEYACIFVRPPRERLGRAARFVGAIPTFLSEEAELDLHHCLATGYTASVARAEALVRMIREVGGESELAILAVSGRLAPNVERALEAAGADAVLDKSLGPDLIAQAADAVLERRRLAR